MNAKKIARIIEVLFQGPPEDEEAPLPHSKRFQWKDPKTGKAPPRPPSDMLPNEDDMRDLEMANGLPPGEETGGVHPGSGDVIEPSDLNGPEVKDMTDRIGKHSLSSLLPPGEIATIDHLLDVYLQMQKTHGPDAAKAWFDRYRTAEFESLVRRMVNAIMEDNNA